MRQFVTISALVLVVALLWSCDKKGDQITNNYYTVGNQDSVRIPAVGQITISLSAGLPAKAMFLQIWTVGGNSPWISNAYMPDSGYQQSVSMNYDANNYWYCLYAALVTTSGEKYWSQVVRVHRCDTCQ
jgi:hypothetical protein